MERDIKSKDLIEYKGPVWWLGKECFNRKQIPSWETFCSAIDLPLPTWIKKIQHKILAKKYTNISFGWSVELFWTNEKDSSVEEHYDNDDVYTIQIFGKKKWIVDLPNINNIIKLQKQGKITRTSFHDSWLRNDEEIIQFENPQHILMEPGDFLCIPAFSLHKVTTTTEGRNLSINASICQEQNFPSLDLLKKGSKRTKKKRIKVRK